MMMENKWSSSGEFGKLPQIHEETKGQWYSLTVDDNFTISLNDPFQIREISSSKPVTQNLKDNTHIDAKREEA